MFKARGKSVGGPSMTPSTRSHLEWGPLLGWYRNCTFLESDHDLDIAVFASSWTPALEHHVLEAMQRVWCGAASSSMRMKHHPYRPSWQTPIQLVISCEDHSTRLLDAEWDLIDITFMHRPGSRRPPPAADRTWNQANATRDEVIRQGVPTESEAVWWTSNNDAWQHWRYEPYHLVPAKVFGVDGWAPSNTARHLAARHGHDWHVQHVFEAYDGAPSPRQYRGMPDIRGVKQHKDERWRTSTIERIHLELARARERPSNQSSTV